MGGIFSGASAIIDFGILAVIGALFIFIFWIQFRNNLKQILLVQKQTIDQNKLLLDHLLKEMSKLNCNNRNDNNGGNPMTDEHVTQLRLRMDISNKINLKLKQIIIDNNFDRVSIFEFHNSNYNFSGLPFAKFSTTYEAFSKGIKPLINDYINMPFGSISDIVSLVQDNGGYYVIDDLNEIENNGLIYNICKTHKAKHIMFFGLYDINQRIFALMYCEYKNNYEPSKHIEELKQEVSYFSSILDLNKTK